MKVLLTGVAGTGKSTLAEALAARGANAIDLHDIPGIFYWQDLKTKERVEYTPVHAQDWFETVDRLCDIPKLKEILDSQKDIVVSGSTSGSNLKEFLSLFDKIILLQASPETILSRMETRTNKSGFGKTKAEQDDNLEWQKEFDPELISYGAIPVSTEGDLNEVTDRIVKLIND
jgi:broad-specificity NMP kinase